MPLLCRNNSVKETEIFTGDSTLAPYCHDEQATVLSQDFLQARCCLNQPNPISKYHSLISSVYNVSYVACVNDTMYKLQLRYMWVTVCEQANHLCI